MAKQDRSRIINEIENIRNSKLLAYLCGDRRNFETRIHPEIQTSLYRHLQRLGQHKKIDLFLYSTGGVTMAAWSIVNLIREFCEEFTVIVPFKAFSTATLICLGADEIIMGKLGQLGPVDPSVNMPFNPPAPGNVPGRVLPISVEEVASFIQFSKDDRFVGLKGENALGDVLKQLTSKVHPLALGSVYRATEQIRMLSEKLLKLHMTREEDQSEILRIVEALTKNLYSHDYIINRKEAKNEIKLRIKDAEDVNGGFENLIYDLFHEYEEEMCLGYSFNPEILLGNNNVANEIFKRAFIDSENRTDIFITEKEFKKVPLQQGPPNMPVPQTVIQERIIKEGWEEER